MVYQLIKYLQKCEIDTSEIEKQNVDSVINSKSEYTRISSKKNFIGVSLMINDNAIT